SEVQRNVAQRRAEAARRLLAIVVGLQELPLLDLAGDLDVTPPDFAWQPLLENLLGRSSEIQSGMALNAQADRLLARARAEVCPNFYIQVRPIYSFPDRTPEAMVELGARLPLWDRNQGNIAAARADVARTQAEIRQVELSLMARLNAAFQKYQTARQQAQAYNERILRHAQDSLDLVRKAYERGEGKFDYTAVLQAQLILFQARLVYVQTLGEVWRGVSEIAGLLQLDDINVAGYPRQGCPAPAGRPEFLPPPSPPGVGTLPRPAAVPGPNPS
ncbi:MAG TPA: TolC family protein, partial [Gemmataceae bacterium]|nr:TolC family protein [Gemmataceae bacterium]